VTPSPGWDVNPGDVINLPDMVSVSAGSLNAIGLRNDGTVWSWGLGPLGNGTNGQSATPVRVNNLTDIVAISTGGSSRTSMALDAQGHVWTWGSDFYRQLGYAQPGGVALSPGQVNLECVTSISMGVFSAAAVTSDGSLYVWGYNGDGQLGQGTVGDVVGYNGPVRVVDLSNIVQVSCGAAHILARRADGTVWACGGNGQGQLGDGTTTRRTRFVQVAVINDAADISAGYFHSLAKRSDLSAWSWGSNSNHELGTGAYPAGGPYSTPARMLNPPTVRALDGGNGSSVMIAGDGTLWTCGNNGNGELGRTTSGVALDLLPTPVNSSVGAAVSASAGGNFMMVVAPGARIVAPVADKLAAGGSTVQLAVSAVGAPPLSYSWRRNGQLLANTGRISGADGPVLTIASSDTNDSGTFTVRVSNAANVVASDPVTLITPPLLNRFDTQTYADAWFTNQRGAWAVMGGGYAATNPSWNPATYNAFRLPLSDFSIELDVVNASFAGFSYNSGIWLRSSLKSHRYAADSSNPHGVLLALGDLQTGQPNAGDLYWTRWQGAGGQSPQGAVPNVYHTGDTVHLRVEVRGNTYSAFVNDAVTPTTQLTTAEFPAGSLGLFDSSAGDPLFDNVFIQTLPTCPSGSGLEPIRITQRPLSQTAPTGALVTLTVAASGSGPFTYQWLHNGLRIDAHGPSFAFTANNATAGRWECTVTNACGSVGSYPALVTIGSIGDSDGDGGVDLDDHADFVACLIGPQGGVQPGCAVFDIDGDADVDLMDFAVFQKVFGF
jgi:alpha-tubulin suppressor-like RCC1 family protein